MNYHERIRQEEREAAELFLKKAKEFWAALRAVLEARGHSVVVPDRTPFGENSYGVISKVDDMFLSMRLERVKPRYFGEGDPCFLKTKVNGIHFRESKSKKSLNVEEIASAVEAEVQRELFSSKVYLEEKEQIAKWSEVKKSLVADFPEASKGAVTLQVDPKGISFIVNGEQTTEDLLRDLLTVCKKHGLL